MSIRTESEAIAELSFLLSGPPKTAEETIAMATRIRDVLERHYLKKQNGVLRYIPGIDEAALTEIAAHSLTWLLDAVINQPSAKKTEKKPKPMGTPSKPLF